MRFEVKLFSILFIGILLFGSLVSAELSEDEITNKINRYVIDYSGLSEEYFNEHYTIKILGIQSYESICNGPEEQKIGASFPHSVFCGEECPGPNCVDETSFFVKAKWDFKINGYEGEVGDQIGSAIYVEEPREFGFVFKNNEVKEHARYLYKNQVLQNRPFPKFEEITTTIPQKQLDEIKNNCGTFTRSNAIKLTTNLIDDETLSLVFYSWGEKGGKNVELLVNLENGDNQCNEIQLFGQDENNIGGVKTSIFDHPLLILGIIIVVILVIGFFLLKKR